MPVVLEDDKFKIRIKFGELKNLNVINIGRYFVNYNLIMYLL